MGGSESPSEAGWWGVRKSMVSGLEKASGNGKCRQPGGGAVGGCPVGASLCGGEPGPGGRHAAELSQSLTGRGAISQSRVKEPGSARGAGRAGMTAATVEGGKGLQSVPSLIDQTSCELAGLQSWLALGRRGLFALAIILGSFEMKCLCKWSSVTLDRSRPCLWGSFFISVMMRDLHKQPP